jgi:hypothetical protein
MFNLPNSTFLVFFVVAPLVIIIWLVWWVLTFKNEK